jgi:Flp pilus assembly CpaE family ATPase
MRQDDALQPDERSPDWSAPGQEPKPSQLVRNLVTLEKAPAFFALPDHQLRRLARRMRPVDLPPRTRVVEQGRLGDSLFVIDRGSCLLAVETEPGRLVSVTRLGEGDLCGETVMLGEPSPVLVTTVAESRLLALDRTSLRSVIPEGSPGDAELRRQIVLRHQGYKEFAARAHWHAASDEAVVIGVYAPKGGSGRTTIALNLAAQLAKEHPGRVLLVDLDFPYNQAALLSGLVPTGSLTRASWSSVLGTLGDLEDALLSAALLHPSGYMVLPGVIRVEESELVTTEQVTGAIRTLRGAFKHIIVDLGIALSDTALSVFDMASQVVLVITPELPSLNGGRHVLSILRDSLHMPEERVKLILNQRQASSVVPREAVERALGRPPSVEVGHDGNKPERAVLEGTLVALSDPKSEVARATRKLADQITATEATAGKEAPK